MPDATPERRRPRGRRGRRAGVPAQAHGPPRAEGRVPRRVDVLVAALLLVLGFALAVQVRSTQRDDLLTSARQEDLVQILDELQNRSDRLQQEVDVAQRHQAAPDHGQRRPRRRAGRGPPAHPAARGPRRDAARLRSGRAGPDHRPAGLGQRLGAARRPRGAAQRRRRGHPARGHRTGRPGRRGAGGRPDRARGHRRGRSRWTGRPLLPPYRFVAVGDPATLSGAMAIPGGVEDAVRQQGGTCTTDDGRHRAGDRLACAEARSLRSPRVARRGSQPLVPTDRRAPVNPADLRYTAEHEWIAAERAGACGSASPTTPRTPSATSSS